MRLFRLFEKTPQAHQPARRIPEGLRLYAVGDMHGRLDLLEQLLGLIGDDADGAPHLKFVFLGDYIDRGPRSREVVDKLLELKVNVPDHCVFLRGNHDDTLLQFLDDPEVGPHWCENGGADTLVSYGVTPPLRSADPADWRDAQAQLAELMPAEHLSFFRELQYSYEIGDYFFAHAGVRPDVPLWDQSPHDLMWIRDDFIRYNADVGKTIVHGHTPEEAPFISAQRIGIDTGAYATGVLTALVLEGDSKRIIQARRRPDYAPLRNAS